MTRSQGQKKRDGILAVTGTRASARIQSRMNMLEASHDLNQSSQPGLILSTQTENSDDSSPSGVQSQANQDLDSSGRLSHQAFDSISASQETLAPPTQPNRNPAPPASFSKQSSHASFSFKSPSGGLSQQLCDPTSASQETLIPPTQSSRNPASPASSLKQSSSVAFSFESIMARGTTTQPNLSSLPVSSVIQVQPNLTSAPSAQLAPPVDSIRLKPPSAALVQPLAAQQPVVHSSPQMQVPPLLMNQSTSEGSVAVTPKTVLFHSTSFQSSPSTSPQSGPATESKLKSKLGVSTVRPNAKPFLSTSFQSTPSTSLQPVLPTKLKSKSGESTNSKSKSGVPPITSTRPTSSMTVSKSAPLSCPAPSPATKTISKSVAVSDIATQNFGSIYQFLQLVEQTARERQEKELPEPTTDRNKTAARMKEAANLADKSSVNKKALSIIEKQFWNLGPIYTHQVAITLMLDQFKQRSPEHDTTCDTVFLKAYIEARLLLSRWAMGLTTPDTAISLREQNEAVTATEIPYLCEAVVNRTQEISRRLGKSCDDLEIILFSALVLEIITNKVLADCLKLKGNKQINPKNVGVTFQKWVHGFFLRMTLGNCSHYYQSVKANGQRRYRRIAERVAKLIHLLACYDETSPFVLLSFWKKFEHVRLEDTENVLCMNFQDDISLSEDEQTELLCHIITFVTHFTWSGVHDIELLTSNNRLAMPQIQRVVNKIDEINESVLVNVNERSLETNCDEFHNDVEVVTNTKEWFGLLYYVWFLSRKSAPCPTNDATFSLDAPPRRTTPSVRTSNEDSAEQEIEHKELGESPKAESTPLPGQAGSSTSGQMAETSADNFKIIREAAVGFDWKKLVPQPEDTEWTLNLPAPRTGLLNPPHIVEWKEYESSVKMSEFGVPAVARVDKPKNFVHSDVVETMGKIFNTSDLVRKQEAVLIMSFFMEPTALDLHIDSVLQQNVGGCLKIVYFLLFGHNHYQLGVWKVGCADIFIMCSLRLQNPVTPPDRIQSRLQLIASKAVNSTWDRRIATYHMLDCPIQARGRMSCAIMSLFNFGLLITGRVPNYDGNIADGMADYWIAASITESYESNSPLNIEWTLESLVPFVLELPYISRPATAVKKRKRGLSVGPSKRAKRERQRSVAADFVNSQENPQITLIDLCDEDTDFAGKIVTLVEREDIDPKSFIEWAIAVDPKTLADIMKSK
ncbi:hypothetical protein DFJ73DRAFT_834373 [Zopfochytrium polystomum]|nr:hypothetical protein DFJ73DRAFT_834373 [Zopfochytrium polystomum]